MSTAVAIVTRRLTLTSRFRCGTAAVGQLGCLSSPSPCIGTRPFFSFAGLRHDEAKSRQRSPPPRLNPRSSPDGASASIPDLLRQLSKIHSTQERKVEQRRCLDLLQAAYHHQQPASLSQLQRGHVSMLMKAAKCCSHPTMAYWLLHTFYPAPPSPAPSPGVWPRDVELAYLTITSSFQSKRAPASPRLLTDLLLLITQHGWAITPSMLTPALQFYRHYEAWQAMLALLSHCTLHAIPVPRSAYPLLFVALNHTRQSQAALDLLAQAEAELLPRLPVEERYPIYHAALDCLGTNYEDDAALQLFERMKASGLPPKVETYTAVINALKNPNADADDRLALVRRWHGEVEQAGMAISQPLYRALIKAYLRFGSQDEAMRLLKHFMKVHHDAASHFFVLSVCLEVENVDAALLMLDKICAKSNEATRQRQSEWSMHLPVYNRMLELCVSQQKWKAVRTLWAARSQLRVVPNVLSYFFVAQALKPQSASWQELLDSAIPLLPLTSATPEVLTLTLPAPQHENTAAAALWWLLKAARLGWSGCVGKEVHVIAGGKRRMVVDRVAREVGLGGAEWRENGEVRWSRQVVQDWRDGKGKVRPAPQRQLIQENADLQHSSIVVQADAQTGSQPAWEEELARTRERAQQTQHEREASHAEGVLAFGPEDADPQLVPV